jgi:hypothetical protein
MVSEQRDRGYEARRAAHLARFTDHGVAPHTAEHCVAAWEREATAEGRDPESEAFWEGAEEWIVAHRAGAPGRSA